MSEPVPAASEARVSSVAGPGVVKMNTDTQWAAREGVFEYDRGSRGYLHGQIGNPDGEDKPIKKHYDPSAWFRQAELATIQRLKEACRDLKCIDRY